MPPRPLLLAGLLVLAGCGTLVRVSDAAGCPVGKAQIQVVYPSFDGPVVATDDEGYARLRDAWFQRPLFAAKPAGVDVATNLGTWSFDYPPPNDLILDPGASGFRPNDHAPAAAAEVRASRPR